MASVMSDPARLLDESAVLLEGGKVPEALDLLAQAASIVKGDAALEGRIHARIALARDYLGDLAGAVEATERALQALEQSEDHDTHLLARYGLGHRYMRMGRLDDAHSQITQALELARRVGNDFQLGNALINLGNFHLQRQSAEAAAAAYEEALSVFERLGDPTGRAACLASLGNVRQSLRDLDAARELYIRAIDAGSRSSHWIICNDARVNLARVVYEQGDIVAAARWFEQARDEARANGHIARQADTAFDLGLMCENLGDLARAVDAYHECWQLRARTGPPESEGHALRTLIDACRRSAEPQRILQWRRRALQLTRRSGDRAALAEVLDNVATAWALSGRIHRALDYWESALCVTRDIPAPNRAIAILENLRRTYEGRGRPDLALAHMADLVNAYREAGDERTMTWVIHDWSQLLVVVGAPHEALALVDEGESIARRLEDRLLQGLLSGTRANALLAQGDVSGALGAYQQSLSLLEACGEPKATAVTLSNMALAHEAAGDTVKAHTCRRDAERLLGLSPSP